MREKKFALVIVFILSVSFLFPAPKIKEKDLPQKYREWLKLVSYIIRTEERDVFMELTNNRDRDLFIRSFWGIRDPTPGTPQNEYKDEHLKRFLYANKYFKRGSPREGWMTDMARIYIILGPPASIERHDMPAGLYPCQIWSYYGDAAKGLPANFVIVFWQRSGAGEFKLYNQVSDGPMSLLIDKEGIDYDVPRQAYKKILELAPTLAGPSISMIPGQYPFNYQPSPQVNIIMANIFESPKKNVSPSYATHFLNYKGVVSTEYMTNYVECATDIALIQDPIMRVNFLHFSLTPKSVSIDYYEPNDQYFCNFKLDVSFRKDEEIVYQYSKDFPFYFAPDNIDVIRGNGISIQDSFPIIEGKYQVSILLQNSVGKEFSVFERDIVVPDVSEEPKIMDLVLGYKFQRYNTPMHVPFKVAQSKLFVDPKSTFSAKDDVAFFFNISNMEQELWNKGKVKVWIGGLRKQNPIKKSCSLELKSFPYSQILNLTHSIPAQELSPDYYEMKLALVNENGDTIDEKSTNFIISAVEAVPHPVVLEKTFPLSNSFLFFYILAHQYDKVRNYAKAEASYEKVYGIKSDYKEGLVRHANFLVKMKKFDRSLELIESLKDDENMMFEYYLIKGKALMGKGQYPEAIESLLEGNKMYDSDIRLLNSLGFCFYKTQQKDRALEVLRVSLRLNPEQMDIKKLIEEIEKSLD